MKITLSKRAVAAPRKLSGAVFRTLCGTTLCGVLVCGVLLSGAFRADADRISRGPVISPSVRQAHALKYYPPPGWIRHYLGDDRYKLGTTWRVVTTPNDPYYYPPFAREMLMAPPGQIIGFASAQDAQEAGYAPAPEYGSAYGLDIHQMAVADARNNPEPSSGGSDATTINRSTRAQRIILADGVSSVLLPSNWQRTRALRRDISGQSPGQTFTVFADELRPIKGTALIRFFSMNMPNGLNVERYMTLQAFAKGFTAGFSNATHINPNDISVSRASLAGLNGVLVTPKAGVAMLGEVGTRMIVVARGSKVYGMIYSGTNRASGASSVVDSFRPR